jgi:hypothetical protein
MNRKDFSHGNEKHFRHGNEKYLSHGDEKQMSHMNENIEDEEHRWGSGEGTTRGDQVSRK